MQPIFEPRILHSKNPSLIISPPGKWVSPPESGPPGRWANPKSAIRGSVQNRRRSIFLIRRRLIGRYREHRAANRWKPRQGLRRRSKGDTNPLISFYKASSRDLAACQVMGGKTPVRSPLSARWNLAGLTSKRTSIDDIVVPWSRRCYPFPLRSPSPPPSFPLFLRSAASIGLPRYLWTSFFSPHRRNRCSEAHARSVRVTRGEAEEGSRSFVAPGGHDRRLKAPTWPEPVRPVLVLCGSAALNLEPSLDTLW